MNTPLTLPAELASALANDPNAKKLFEALAPSHQKEYIQWISEAKKEATRQTRAAKTIQMLKNK